MIPGSTPRTPPSAPDGAGSGWGGRAGGGSEARGPPPPRRGEGERGGRAESAGADEEHARGEQLELALLADLRDQQVAAVAGALRRVEALRDLRREAVPLPVGEPARQRRHVRVAELAERLRGERRALAARAVEEDRPLALRHRALDPGLQRAARDVDRAGDEPFVPLVATAD